MAVLRTGPIVADIRGSVGDETFARNQGGLYVRARTTPTNPNTQDQQDCRAAMTALSQFWSGDLTEQQRSDWRSYAQQHPQPDRFGNPHLVNGYTRFIQVNFHRYRIDTAVAFPDAPLNPPIHPATFTFTAEATTDTITIDLSFPEWDGGIKNLQVYAYGGPEVNPGVSFYNGPWRYRATNRYNTEWQLDPWTFEHIAVMTEGKKVFYRIVAQMRDHGELSTSYQTSTIVEA